VGEKDRPIDLDGVDDDSEQADHSEPSAKRGRTTATGPSVNPLPNPHAVKSASPSPHSPAAVAAASAVVESSPRKDSPAHQVRLTSNRTYIPSAANGSINPAGGSGANRRNVRPPVSTSRAAVSSGRSVEQEHQFSFPDEDAHSDREDGGAQRANEEEDAVDHATSAKSPARATPAAPATVNGRPRKATAAALHDNSEEAIATKIGGRNGVRRRVPDSDDDDAGRSGSSPKRSTPASAASDTRAAPLVQPFAAPSAAERSLADDSFVADTPVSNRVVRTVTDNVFTQLPPSMLHNGDSQLSRPLSMDVLSQGQRDD